jgi:threonine/homoserine/homoserine lactone efflux protein
MMPAETLVALALFAVAALITPGPNNIMLTASGVTFGFGRTLPHMIGVALGFVVLLLAIGLGVGSLLTAVPQARLVLKVGGALYLVYFAWRIARAGQAGTAGSGPARPMTFLEAAAFQWVNVSAWVMAIAAMGVYVRPGRPVADALTVAAVFLMVAVPSVAFWAAFGHGLRGMLRDPRRLRLFNAAMALLLLATIVPLLAA